METVKVPAGAGTIEGWRGDAEASWEDHGCPSEGHVYNILGRAKTRLVIRNADELALLIADADYRRDGWDDRFAYRAAVGRIADRLKALSAGASA